MGDVDAEDVDELRGKLKALFASTRNGISLPGALSVALVTFYASVMMVGSLDEVSLNDPDELEEAAAEAWQHTHSFEMPRAQIVRVRKWAGEGSHGSKAPRSTLAHESTVGDVGEEDRREAAKKEASEMDLTPFEREKAVKDMAAQGLSCARIIALSLSLILGKVSKLSTCVSLKYGEDPALSEPAKQARKAGKKTIATIIKAKDYAGAGAFFSALMQSYAADGMIEESSLVAAWWAETSGCFSSDKELLFEYLEEYFDKYAGRGLPVKIDTVLVTRIRNASGAGGISKEEMKQVKNRLAELDTANSKLKAEIAALKDGQPKKPTKPSKEELEKRRANIVCHNCGEKGHYASECPEPKKE